MRGRTEAYGLGESQAAAARLVEPSSVGLAPATFSRKGRRTGGLLAALLFLLLAPLATAQPKFPALTGRVVDNARLLSPAAEQQLTAELQALETKTGRQLVVATLPTLGGSEIETYGYQLGRAWGIGNREDDNGALLIVAPRERKVRIEVGYGLEPILTDALSSYIIQTTILPQFRQGRMEQGVVAGARAIAQQLGLPADQARARVVRVTAAPLQRGDSGGGGSMISTIFLIFLVLFVLRGVLGGGRRRRRRGFGMLPVPIIFPTGGWGGGSWGGGGGFGGGGFGGGGGSFGGGGASGSW